MSRYDKIPKSNIDYSKSLSDVAVQWMNSYHEVRDFAIDEVFRSQLWKMAAIISWVIIGIGSILLLVAGS